MIPGPRRLRRTVFTIFLYVTLYWIIYCSYLLNSLPTFSTQSFTAFLHLIIYSIPSLNSWVHLFLLNPVLQLFIYFFGDADKMTCDSMMLNVNGNEMKRSYMIWEWKWNCNDIKWINDLERRNDMNGMERKSMTVNDHDMEWNEMEWNGIKMMLNGMTWNGIRWNGNKTTTGWHEHKSNSNQKVWHAVIKWNWNGMGWNVINTYCEPRKWKMQSQWRCIQWLEMELRSNQMTWNINIIIWNSTEI